MFTRHYTPTTAHCGRLYRFILHNVARTGNTVLVFRGAKLRLQAYTCMHIGVILDNFLGGGGKITASPRVGGGEAIALKCIANSYILRLTCKLEDLWA